jgi:hypothetical protein
MGVYSFLNVNAAIVGPGGAANLGTGAQVAEEGITIEPVEDKNNMVVGADGAAQHSLIASDARLATIRVLKTSPMNALLMAMYNIQSASSSLWGRNVITVADTGSGDVITLQQAAFKKVPTLTYAKEAGFNEWVFDIGKGDQILGVGLLNNQ